MDSPTLIDPRRLPDEPALGAAAVLTLVPADLRLLRKKAALASDLKISELFKLYRQDQGLALAGPAVGAPLATIVVEKLFVLGVERLLVLGWAGSLNPEVKTGDLLIVSEAVSEEGTSAHYPLPSPAGPDPDLTALLEETAIEEGVSFHRGPMWTTDAPYRETQAKVAAYGNQGVLAVDMEMSALQTVAAFRNKALAGLMVISDELSSGRWRPGFKSPEVLKARQVAADLILKTAQKAL